MPIAAHIDEWGKPAWLILMILGFIFWWPVGLAILAYTIWSGRMGCWKNRGFGRSEDGKGSVAGQMAGQMREAARWWQNAPSSGNRAFDEYRSDTLRRLEDEQREFKDFLERLRFAKDRSEFDQFMNERRGRGPANAPDAPQQA